MVFFYHEEMTPDVSQFCIISLFIYTRFLCLRCLPFEPVSSSSHLHIFNFIQHFHWVSLFHMLNPSGSLSVLVSSDNGFLPLVLPLYW